MSDHEHEKDPASPQSQPPPMLDFLNQEERAELSNLQPAQNLWLPPDDFPDELLVELATEEDVRVIHQGFFGPNPPQEWTLEMARAFVNIGRKKTYRLWKEGKLVRFHKD